MAETPTEPAPANKSKTEISARISLNRRLEAGDELFDRVLGRIERLERTRRFRRLLIYLSVWIILIAAAICAVYFGSQAIKRLDWF